MPRRKLKTAFKTTLTLIVLAALGWAGWNVYGAMKTLPSINHSMLVTPSPTRIYDCHKNLLATIGNGQNNIDVSLSQLPQQLIQAVLATEDIRFYENNGFDFRSLMRSAWYDLIHLSLSQGGSTITEQLANNAFLTHEKSLKRKIQELALSMELTHRYTKDEILQMYLNKIYFGAGAYGIGAASQIYFGVTPDKLTLPQEALLAGLPQSPSYYSPLTNPKAALTRRNQVLANMLKYGFITQKAYEQAKNSPLELHPDLSLGQAGYPYATDYIVQELDKLVGEDKVYRGGLVVYTTIDASIEKATMDAMADKANFPASVLDKNGLLQPEGAAVFIDQNTGGIRAIVGGREHNGSMVLNRATQAYRQPGSSIKPFVDYGPAIEYYGLTPDSIVQDTPLTIGDYSPKNYDNTYLGPVTLRYALANSINVVAVRLLDMVTIPKAVQFAQNCGITIDDSGQDGLALALGGMSKGVTPLEMAGAYAAIANEGIYIKPHIIDQVYTQSGLLLYSAPSDVHTAMQPYTDWALTSMLQSVVQYGTGTEAAIPGWSVAGKTGTTNEGKDIWFDGFTPVLTGVVWIGYDQPKAMPQAYGGIYCARIWHQVMTAALAGQTPQSFPIPPGVVIPPAQTGPGNQGGDLNQAILPQGNSTNTNTGNTGGNSNGNNNNNPGTITTEPGNSTGGAQDQTTPPTGQSSQGQSGVPPTQSNQQQTTKGENSASHNT